MQTGVYVRRSSRLSSDERRQAIIEAVKDAFAKKGFDRTTSKDLAKAARVSEALLYKYFPTKQSLYQAMLHACAETPIWSKTDCIEGVKPSTATLIVMVDSLISQVVEGRSVYFDGAVLGRLAVRCLLDEGDFGRTVLKPFTNNWMATFEKCLKNAAASGDLREYPTTPHLCAWLLHHIALGLMLHASPRKPVAYKVPKHTLVRETVCFALRGIGLRDEPIKRHYNSRFTCEVEK
ncbi:MAG TPA: TetR/AcrR family transcriptional regulator [Candidatus Binatia bacterium]|jgi:AcrR family transcriptional regulator